MSGMRSQYRDLEHGYHYIDKTEVLEKEIERFPSVYIEGAAGCGKTTVMRMMLAKHPEVEYRVFWLDEDDFIMDEDEDDHGERVQWIILEHVPEDLQPEIAGRIQSLIRRSGGEDRIFLIGREEIPDGLLRLFWNREMGLVTQNSLLLNLEEIRQMIGQYGSRIAPEQLLEYTGGWSGVVDVILRLEQKYGDWQPQTHWYEMEQYLNESILNTLKQDELDILHLAQTAPWVNAKMCEAVLGIVQAEQTLGKMMRKGFLMYERQEKRWSVAPIFCHVAECRISTSYVTYCHAGDTNRESSYAVKLAEWYKTGGYELEYLQCLEHSDDVRAYADALKRYCVNQSDRQPDDALQDDRISPEVRLNLEFLQPQTAIEQWVEELQPDTGRLLIIQETKVSCLCDMKDMSGLFACKKQREKRLAHKWMACLDEDARTFYRLARMEYYIETDRLGAIPEEDMQMLVKAEEVSSVFHLNILWLLVRVQRFAYDEERQKQIEQLEAQLINTENRERAEYVKAVGSLNITAYGSREYLAEWLKYTAALANEEVMEENIVLFYCQAKGYLLMNQYEKAGRLLDKMLPYLNAHRRSRIHAEVLFEKAVAEWNLGQHGQALKSVIESFLTNGRNRYVMFYTEYGVSGREVLEAYIDWMKHNSPEGWHRKKKYNYGSVLHMPEADYLETILRKTRKEARHMQKHAEYQQKERLTMTETVILQYLVQGLTNAQICEEMNLKLPTVKGHIYNIYKKMGVKNRVQAVMRWKEMVK